MERSDHTTKNNLWGFQKYVLPQHTDHAGIMWHGTYFNWLEESRVNALSDAGIKYTELINKGYQLPVIEAGIKYKAPIHLGQKIIIKSAFEITKSPKIKIKSYFINNLNKSLSIANVTIVLIRNDTFKIEKKRPDFLFNIFKNLSNGPNY
tara:strand:- start:2737 stop:3186 length:450 start_codon:yes stop_codon:yes gene_type:complete